MTYWYYVGCSCGARKGSPSLREVEAWSQAHAIVCVEMAKQLAAEKLLSEEEA